LTARQSLASHPAAKPECMESSSKSVIEASRSHLRP
jgi:hypothetical protein